MSELIDSPVAAPNHVDVFGSKCWMRKENMAKQLMANDRVNMKLGLP